MSGSHVHNSDRNVHASRHEHAVITDLCNISPPHSLSFTSDSLRRVARKTLIPRQCAKSATTTRLYMACKLKLLNVNMFVIHQTPNNVKMRPQHPHYDSDRPSIPFCNQQRSFEFKRSKLKIDYQALKSSNTICHVTRKILSIRSSNLVDILLYKVQLTQ